MGSYFFLKNLTTHIKVVVSQNLVVVSLHMIYIREKKPMATVPVLTSDKEEKHVILPTTFNFLVRGANSGVILSKTPQRYSECFTLVEVIRNML